MEQYLDLVADTLREGTYKPNRTGVDTISAFSRHYEVDLANGYPLLTTKRMDGFRWESMLHELLWYLSGEEHVRDLREKTGIWDEWADDEGHLDTAYGRFWRRYPIPDEGLPGETWAGEEDDWVSEEGTFDQIEYVLDQLEENPNSRRIVVNAWHPANAAVSTLPPCHYTFVFNVQGDRLNLHLTQRSGDIALGVPFNLAAYALLLTAVAQQTGFTPGRFAHTIVDAHVYCGEGDRGEWYDDNLAGLRSRLETEGPLAAKSWIEAEAPDGSTDPRGKPYDHVPGLLEQLSRDPNPKPTIEIADKPLDALEFDDITLRNYDSHSGLDFGVAE